MALKRMKRQSVEKTKLETYFRQVIGKKNIGANSGRSHKGLCARDTTAVNLPHATLDGSNTS